MRKFSSMLGAFAPVLALVLVLVLALAGGSPANAESGVPLPNLAKAEKGEQCVEPADTMRREHMNYLQHQRDETLREGIRGKKYSLNACIDCHATASPDVAGGKVRTLKPFCAECHHYAAVSIDCFQCHSGAAPKLPMKNTQAPDDANHLLARLDRHLQIKKAENPQ